MTNKKKVEVEEKEIFKGQTLFDIYPSGLPSNAIINKVLPGLGATYCEINSPRNSFIIEPNVPVIKGKKIDYPNLIVYHYGIDIKDVERALKRKSEEPKKIMTTPESYEKVRDCAMKVGINLKEDYFYMIDECEKIVQDADYRTGITKVFNDFFDYNNKCLVSATPLYADLHGFVKQDFKEIKIKPLYEYRQDIDLIVTNNVEESFKAILKSDKPQAIFLNSVAYSKYLIEKLELQDAFIHCSEEYAKKYNKDGINAVSDFTELHQYNFFTSRFYSAVDFKTDMKPDVIMLTQIFYGEKTIIDPSTNSIQIQGRFRNGISSLTHITNYKVSFVKRNKEEHLNYLRTQYECYKIITSFKELADSEAGKDLLEEIKTRLHIGELIKEDGKLNPFLVANEIEKEQVKSYYKYPESIYESYQKVDFFKVNFREEHYNSVEEVDYSTFEKKRYNKDIRLEDLERLHQLRPNPLLKKGAFIFTFEYLTLEDMQKLEHIEERDPLLYKFYHYFGYEAALNIEVDTTKMKNAVAKKDSEEMKRTNFPALNDIIKAFKIGEEYSEAEIIMLLTKIYNKHGIEIKTKKLAATELKHYFNLSPRRSIKKMNKQKTRPKGYEILCRNFEMKRL